MKSQRARRRNTLGFCLCWLGAAITLISAKAGYFPGMIPGCILAGVGVILVALARLESGERW